MTRNFSILLCFLVCVATLDLYSSFAHAQNPGGLVVLLEFADHRPSYKVNSARVAYGDLLNRLSDEKPKWPAVAPRVILLANEQATLSQIDAVRGIIAKAGYEWPQVYYFGKDKRQMIELTYSPAIPFSEHDIPLKK